MKKHNRRYFSKEMFGCWVIHLVFMVFCQKFYIFWYDKVYDENFTMVNAIWQVFIPLQILLLIVLNIFYYVLYVYKIPFFEKMKITNVPWPWEENSTKFFKKQLPDAIKTYLGNLLLYMIILHVFKRFFYCRIDESYPSLLETIIGVYVFALYEDFHFYWAHRFLHHPSLYSIIHKNITLFIMYGIWVVFTLILLNF